MKRKTETILNKITGSFLHPVAFFYFDMNPVLFVNNRFIYYY
jgi:hypothetical protein